MQPAGEAPLQATAPAPAPTLPRSNSVSCPLTCGSGSMAAAAAAGSATGTAEVGGGVPGQALTERRAQAAAAAGAWQLARLLRRQSHDLVAANGLTAPAHLAGPGARPPRSNKRRSSCRAAGAVGARLKWCTARHVSVKAGRGRCRAAERGRRAAIGAQRSTAVRRAAHGGDGFPLVPPASLPACLGMLVCLLHAALSAPVSSGQRAAAQPQEAALSVAPQLVPPPSQGRSHSRYVKATPQPVPRLAPPPTAGRLCCLEEKAAARAAGARRAARAAAALRSIRPGAGARASCRSTRGPGQAGPAGTAPPPPDSGGRG